MNINELYWKVKRFLRKNKETISRGISIVLIVVLLTALGVAAVSIIRADNRREELANQEKDDTVIKVDRKKDYGEPGFKQVAENDKLVLYADFTTAEIMVEEKATGMKWYSNPQDRADDELATIKSRVDSQIHVKFMNKEEGIFIELDSSAGSVKKGRMEHRLIENGVKFIFGFPVANVYIPVQYTLCEDGFQAEIVTSEIEGVGANPYMIDTIALLPYFGAGGLEDEGYLFVPDGSGALINFNNEKQSSQAYTAQVYDVNPTIVAENAKSISESVKLPVFGVKCNENAFIGVIISGEGASKISASTSRKGSSYNYVHPVAVMHEYNSKRTEGNASAAAISSHSIDMSDNLMDGKNYAVRYFFMEGEQANYAGMSQRYRAFIEQCDQLNDSSLTDKKYVVLDLIGAVSIKKYVMGVLRPVVTPLTTYNEVCDVVKELKAAGVENIIVNYIGAMDGGLNNKVYNKVSLENVLGTKKELENMIQYLQDEGVLLFLETNPVDIYESGNGYSDKGDTVKTFFEKYAYQYNYNLDLGTKIEDTSWNLLRPRLAAELSQNFAESAASWNVNQISLARLGQILYANYEKGDEYLSRTSALELWDKTLKNIDEKLDYMMFHGGNAYCLPYADAVTDISNSHSNYDMENQSVPFYQMTFQDSVLLTADGINTTVDYEYAFLKAIETGCSLKYNLICDDVSQLVGTDYNTMVSYSYDYWKETIVEEYTAMQKAVSQLAGKKIVGHEYLQDDVTLTVYDSAKVIVNYGENTVTYEGNEIGARNYLILSGGAK